MRIVNTALQQVVTAVGLVALTFATSVGLKGQAIQLRGGEVLVGEVIDANSDGLSFRRLDNGGLLELGWPDLSPLHADRIRRIEGIIVEEEGEITVPADVLLYRTGGGSINEVVGLIVEYTDTHVMLKRKNGVLPVPRQSIAGPPRNRDVPVLEIFTRAEYYQRKLAEVNPGDDPDLHVVLGDEMRRVRLYEEAEEHLTKAVGLGGGKHSGELPAMIERVRRLRESAAERDLLSEIRIQRNRRNFAKAAELIEQFETEYANSELARELTREKQRFDDARQQFLIEEIRTRWDTAVRDIARSKAGERDTTLSQARSFIENNMAAAAFERIARLLDIDPKEAGELWSKRRDFVGPRTDVFSYGVGSWVLGEDAITKDTAVTAAPGAGAGSGPEDRELERLIRKLQETRERGRAIAAQRDQNAQDTEEDWWNKADRNERTLWIRAYFAENGGAMEVTRAYAFKCAACDGAGFLVQLGSTGEEQRTRCATCRGTRMTRAIRAR